MTLIEFLTARLDEDEAVARAASPGGWRFGEVGWVAGGMLYDETRAIGSVCYEQIDDHNGTIVRHLLSDEANANGRHIVSHDPMRVLREVAAKRRVVEILASVQETVERVADPDVRPQYQGQARGLLIAAVSLARAYSDHPDYRDEWA